MKCHFEYTAVCRTNCNNHQVRRKVRVHKIETKIASSSSFYLLTSGELELGPPESLNDRVLVLVVSPHAHQGLSNSDTGHGSQGLAKGSPHPSLEPIGTSARQHFVDPQHVEGVDTDPDVELILRGVLDQVLERKGSKTRINIIRHSLLVVRGFR